MTSMLALIHRKRDGGELARDEIDWMISRYLAGDVDDAQMSALLMAGLLNGFSDDEAVALTEALVHSGRSIDLSMLQGPTVDKHSTGGVGDVTTLVVAPLLAAAGAQVAKLSGRGLGHTGGTLDKLGSIPGFDVELAPARFLEQVERVGVAVTSAGPDLVPGDRRLYALRDVTGTVEDPALIAASVMSKKLAGGAQHILLDVKVGDGAFMADLERGRALARRCVAIGRAHGRETAALLTQMGEPLASAVGNALEVAAAVEVLQGHDQGPLCALSLELAAAAFSLTGPNLEDANRKMRHVLESGQGLEKFREWIAAQGGDERVADEPWKILPSAPIAHDWTPSPGVVQSIETRLLGELAGRLGAGRTRLGDAIEPSVGLEVLLRTGQETDPQAPGVRIHARSEQEAAAVARDLDRAIVVGESPRAPLPLILDRVGLDEPPTGP